jgi:HTH-type transcriptional regulator/antitoxin HigA
LKSERQPYELVHHGEIISDELEARGWTQKDLAEIMGRPIQAVSEIINGKKRITPDTAIELGQAFGTTPEFWMNMETSYQLWLSKRSEKKKDVPRRSRLYSLVPVAELRRKGWIRNTKNIDDLEKDVLDLLGTPSLDAPLRSVMNPRQAKVADPQNVGLIVWTRRVELLVRNQNLPPFSSDGLNEQIGVLLACTAEARSVAKIPAILNAAGLRFAIAPHLSKSHLDGGAFWFEERPVVALTLRHDRIDWFWFTLMHELAHHALGHTGIIFDIFGGPETDQSRKERQADRLAQDWLIDPQSYAEYIAANKPYFSTRSIASFAESIDRHPGIVAGRLQHDKHIGFGHSRSFLQKVSPFLSEWIDKPKAA